jgi:hypothetical protein
MIAILLAYFMLAGATGLGLTFLSRMRWDLEGRLAAGLVIGIATAALLTWVIAIPLGMSLLPVGLGALALMAVLAACRRWAEWRLPLSAELAAAGERWRSRQALPLGLLISLAAFFFIPFYSHAFRMRADGLYAGHANIWGDWGGTHLSLAGYLSSAHHLLPPESPWFSGVHVTYSFLPDFFSSILLRLGAGLTLSLSLPSAILSIALVVLFYSVALRLTGSRWAALAAALILFVGGGLGFTLMGDDINPTDDGPLGWIAGLLNVLGSPPRDYTFIPELGYWWRNPIIAYLIPQRSALFGWMLGLVVLALLWHSWKRQSRREMLVAGIIVGVMPLFHANTFIDLMILSGGLFLLSLRRWRDWAHYFIPAVVLGIPLLLMLLPPPELRHSWRVVQLGWMASTDGRSDNILLFWLTNTALLIPLALLAFLPGHSGVPHLRRFLLPMWILFVLPNIFVFQPWDFDNSKWFIWWAIPAAILAGIMLVRLGRRGRLFGVAAVIALLVQVSAGALALDRAWQESLNSYRLVDNDGLALAAWARANSGPEAVFLTSSEMNHPIRAMGERKQVMGSLVWLWSFGIDYRPRQVDVLAMFHGDAAAPTLLKQYGVDYVVIGPQEIQDDGANLNYYKAHYPMTYLTPTGEYEVFRVGGVSQ